MMRLITALVLALCLAPVTSWSFDERDPLLVEPRLSRSEWSPGQGGELILKLTLPPNYHGYEDQLKLRVLEPAGFSISAPKISPLIEFFDKFSGKNRKGFKGTTEVRAQLEAPAEFQKSAQKMKVELTYQACSETYCLFPISRDLELGLQLVGAPSQFIPFSEAPSTSLFSFEAIRETLTKNLPLAFVLVFIGGILTSFTPCIFPMIPITLAVIGHESEKRSRAQNFLLSLSYVHGIATTYAVLGLIAASTGALFGASLGNPWVLSVLCLLFLVMALGMYGLFELQVPAFLRQSLGTKKTAPGYVGAYFSGLIAGIVASPCVGPVLVGLLAWVSTTGSNVLGFFLLFTYAMGLGLIFLILGAFTELTRRLPRSGPWLQAVKFALATLMLGVFYYYLSFLLPARWHDAALGAGLVTLGSLTGAFATVSGAWAFARLRKGLAQSFFVIGLGYLAFAVFDARTWLLPGTPHTLQASNKIELPGWQNYSEELVRQAAAEGKPVVIDFWAEWCAACFELVEHTFANPEVQKRLEGFVLLKFDATRDSAALRELKSRWQIQGLPTLIFLNEQGEWRQDLTLTQFERAPAFLRRLDRL